VKDLPEEPGKDFKQAEKMYGLNTVNIKMYKKTDEEIRESVKKRVEEKRIKEEDEKERIWKEKNNIQIEI
jgi:hypothetical protein